MSVRSSLHREQKFDEEGNAFARIISWSQLIAYISPFCDAQVEDDDAVEEMKGNATMFWRHSIESVAGM